MPVYEYACTTCGERTEARQSFDDPPLEECPICGGHLRKLYSPVGIVFKGSGFYSTESRTGRDGASSTSTSSDKSDKRKSDKDSSSSSGSGSGEQGGSKPDSGSGSGSSSGSGGGTSNKSSDKSA
jgi:putative FmdB family regulatory protein